MAPGTAELTRALKSEANRLGFVACGVSRAEFLNDEARKLELWLDQGRHASMSWMENHFDKRVDPRKLVDGAKSVISVGYSYYSHEADVSNSGWRGSDDGPCAISMYAQNEDYHQVLKEKLWALFEWMRTNVGDVQGRAFVDSAPVMDKVWAARAGLGWIGKHTNLISRDIGSYFFIGELIVDVDLTPDSPIADYCGTCTKCIDACPTDAIYESSIVDASKCISYWTIEHRGDDIPDAIADLFGKWIFGCDICQQVCPWNKFSEPSTESRFGARDEIRRSPHKWEEIDLEEFRTLFRRSPVKRTKFDGFMRNVRIARANSDTATPSREEEL